MQMRGSHLRSTNLYDCPADSWLSFFLLIWRKNIKEIKFAQNLKLTKLTCPSHSSIKAFNVNYLSSVICELCFGFERLLNK